MSVGKERPDGTYWTATAVFVRLPGEDRWTLEGRFYDGDESHSHLLQHGRGPLCDQVLGEYWDAFISIAESQQTRLEGIQHFMPGAR